ncbi:MAG: cation:proton antiporter [Rikenellaceae bacterium]
MEETALLAPLAFIVISLMAGAILKLVLQKINLPYTVGLFVLGIIVGILNLNGFLEATPVISESITQVCNIDPDLILNIFLPILIFSAAYELDIQIFKKTLVNSTLLAVPGMIIAMFMTGALMIGISHLAPSYGGWNWSFALMFGALISATDPVAVVALLGELGVSKKFSTLIDSESMLNDGTGIVLFTLMLAPFTAAVDAADPSPVISFLVVVFGGLAVGYLMARAYVFYTKLRSVRDDLMLQMSMVILLSYLTFILAQDIFKLSGVIALVAFGLAVAYYGSKTLNERVQTFMKDFWGLLSHIANTLIFLIIGIIIAEKVSFTWADLAVLLTVYVGINIIRFVMISMLYPILKRNGYGLTKRESIILTWGALRGALGLTLALIVSYTEAIPEDIRRQVLLLTSGIVALTLVINATTIKWLLNKLGLTK